MLSEYGCFGENRLERLSADTVALNSALDRQAAVQHGTVGSVSGLERALDSLRGGLSTLTKQVLVGPARSYICFCTSAIHFRWTFYTS